MYTYLINKVHVRCYYASHPNVRGYMHEGALQGYNTVTVQVITCISTTWKLFSDTAAGKMYSQYMSTLHSCFGNNTNGSKHHQDSKTRQSNLRTTWMPHTWIQIPSTPDVSVQKSTDLVTVKILHRTLKLPDLRTQA